MKHERSGKPYRLSNWTEGMSFIETYCCNCIYDNPDYEAKEPRCEILTLTMGLDTNDPDYPKEWIHNNEWRPSCTAFKKWDWGNDGDPGDPENPKYVQPDDPNQLCLPLSDIVPKERSILV